ncbi:hypothetical protein B0T11DRAFT_278022 [Plectosphaerella cucumerina]|uniref:Uncharacterized protein n=1 Tax=Plectosphaerella cucumerina TaxID=40658 RepID=A0A8K0X6L8_9PEZI|nr:hypothetical protein B0T11DRAFT_278022 [Plectosphaerella cucumerina]
MTDEVTFKEHNSFFAFRAYVTVPGVTRETVLRHLVHPDADDDEGVLVEVCIGETVQSLIQHHDENTPIRRDSDVHPRMFIVIDSTDLQERGVLLVGLQQYHGHNDAVRGPIEEMRDSLLSMSIANTDWWEEKPIRADSNPKAVPKQWFTAYNLHDDQTKFDEAFLKLNEGLYDVHVDEDEDDEMEMEMETVETPDDDALSDVSISSHLVEVTGGDEAVGDDDDQGDDEEAIEEAEDDPNMGNFYRAFKPDTSDLDQIAQGHATQAQQHKQDPNMFVVIDQEYEAEGFLIMRVTPERDSFRCKGAVAGELLRWIWINLMTWDGAKAYAARQENTQQQE